MTILWKGAAALGLAIAALGATAAPAQVQYYGYGGRDGYREWRGDRDWDRRWDNRRHWRGDDRRYWRGDRRHHYRHYRQRCWTEWRYDYYRDRDVRVRICR